jgi:hypothetical protein
LATQPTRIGRKHARVLVEGHGAGAQTPLLYAAIVATADDAALAIVPTEMNFYRADGSQQPRDYTRNALVVNNGHFSLQRRAVTLSGPDQAAFTIVGSRYPQDGSLDAPPPLVRQIDPAREELITVRYHPMRPGTHQAQMHIETDAGSETIALHGVCNGPCDYSAR